MIIEELEGRKNDSINEVSWATSALKHNIISYTIIVQKYTHQLNF